MLSKKVYFVSKKSKIDCSNIAPRANKSVENEAKQGKGTTGWLYYYRGTQNKIPFEENIRSRCFSLLSRGIGRRACLQFHFARRFRFVPRRIHEKTAERFVNLPREKKVWQKFLARINTGRNSADPFSIVSFSLS